MRGRHRKLLPLLAITLAALACTTVSNEFLQKVGTTALFLTDADLRRQDLDNPYGTTQVAEWVLTTADLAIGGETGDMLFGEEEICVFTDTAVVTPIPEGRCASGMVIGANTEETPVEVTLTLEFTMTVRRAVPVALATPDDDSDGRDNEVDNCPYFYNPGQEDDDGDGDGDACTLVDSLTGFRQLDSDGDGWPDSLDNCIWEPNQDQSDTRGTGANGIADGIGDACEEQVATVGPPGTRFVLTLPTGEPGTIDLVQLQNQVTFLTVDFESRNSLTGCWDDNVCELDVNAIKLCVNNSLVAAVSGCP